MVSINSNTKILAIKLMASAFDGVVKILIVKKIVNACLALQLVTSELLVGLRK